MQPRLLADLDVLVDLERQRRRLVEHLDLLGHDLDLAGGQARVLVALGPLADRAGRPEARTRCAARGPTVLVADHHLGDARGVAQVEEGDPAVVAAARHPAGERDGLAGVLGAEGACLVGAQHGGPSLGYGGGHAGIEGPARPVDPTRARGNRSVPASSCEHVDE